MPRPAASEASAVHGSLLAWASWDAQGCNLLGDFTQAFFQPIQAFLLSISADSTDRIDCSFVDEEEFSGL